VVQGANTRVDDRLFDEWLPGRPHDMRQLAYDPGDPTAEPEEEVEEDARGLHENVAVRISGDSFRDWGRESSFSPYADFRSGSGLIVGAGPRWTRYGFR